ncbi:dormancy-associated protein homolog 3-like isoform X2 [Cynara cardunculus var. scolymus]|uniref:dormancy-associated protein homolog 3-like isoform X2 n=1 Tax=Cynara cardunculus var. scolymus TaxID=59895 RepID=UPI000D62A70B|nr:dormancy-associated protein homolog 3-like isoform X2 [Cynara cardunculus var. scolymus]
MSLLDQFWDDTVAGPRPDKGLGKLRKHSTFSFGSSDSGKELPPVTSTAVEDPTMRVTRSIMIVKPERTLTDTPPASPAGSTTPVSPFPDQRHSGFGGSLHRMLSRRQAGLEPGALVLLTTCEM